MPTRVPSLFQLWILRGKNPALPGVAVPCAGRCMLPAASWGRDPCRASPVLLRLTGHWCSMSDAPPTCVGIEVHTLRWCPAAAAALQDPVNQWMYAGEAAPARQCPLQRAGVDWCMMVGSGVEPRPLSQGLPAGCAATVPQLLPAAAHAVQAPAMAPPVCCAGRWQSPPPPPSSHPQRGWSLPAPTQTAGTR